jgi:hypothetical protein
MSHPLPQESLLHLTLRLYIINSLEVKGAGVSPSDRTAYLAPALCMFCLPSVVFSSISYHPQLGFQDKLMQHVRYRELKKTKLPQKSMTQ